MNQSLPALGIAEKNKTKFILVVDCGLLLCTFDHFLLRFFRSDLFLSYDPNYKELVELEGVPLDKIIDLPVKYDLNNYVAKYDLSSYFQKIRLTLYGKLFGYNEICSLLHTFQS